MATTSMLVQTIVIVLIVQMPRSHFVETFLYEQIKWQLLDTINMSKHEHSVV